MRLAVLQELAVVNDLEANLATVVDGMRAAADRGADVLVTPELFLTGYAPAAVRAAEASEAISAALEQVAQAAREIGIAVVVSFPAQDPDPAADDAWQIRAALIDADGRRLLDYGKVHLFGRDEAAAFSPSEKAPTVVDLLGVPTSMVICFDVEFPEIVRAAAVAGAELILAPTAMSEGFPEVSEVLLRARALENHAIVAYSNHAGVEDGIRYDGRSVIVGPHGRDLARAGQEPELIIADLDFEEVRRARAEIPYLDQRRPDLYSRWERG
ncbi:carbon-nitrogen hydrolase family protein [Kocuria palustris]|uniref:carbon-nitrogen hydrolase family protein n=1 Tax=Kocuria palustris TaxID=71999 RepID=UPI003450679D